MIPELLHHLPEDILEEIRIFAESIIESTGVHGHTIPVLRHVLLTLVAILLAFIAERVYKYLFASLVLRLVEHTQTRQDDIVLDHQVLRVTYYIVPALVVWQLMSLIFYQYHIVQVVLARVTAIYLTVVTTRFVMRFIDRLRYLNIKPGDPTSLYLKSFCGALKILTISIAVVMVVGILVNHSPMTLLAGLGTTSAVLMLVFRDAIGGFVAGVRLTSNEMIHIGDRITLSGGFVDGMVIDITLTTVKIRQSDNTTTTVSFLVLVSGMFQSWKGVEDVEGQRVKKMIYFGVRNIRIADDGFKQQLIDKGLAKVDNLKGEVVTTALPRRYTEHYLTKRKDVNTKIPLLVCQLEAAQAGIPMEPCFFLRRKDWIPYGHVMAGILEHVYTYANELGSEVYVQASVQ